MDSWINVAAAGLTLTATLIGFAQYLNFKTKRQRQIEVGQAFSRVVAGLGSDSQVERLSSAALMRRFFDRRSEFGQGGAPYATDAVKVMTAVLRTEPGGPLQKLLGDGLAAAPSLKGADLQEANLSGCYLGAKESPGLDLSEADLFRADLTGASLRCAVLSDAQFRESTLIATKFDGADCRGANFDFSNLKGASFWNAHLSGATFVGAINLPAIIARHLSDGKFIGPDQMPHKPKRSATQSLLGMPRAVRIFVSSPSQLATGDSVVLEQILLGIQQAGAEPVRYLPAQYNKANPLHGVLQEVATCQAVIVFGPPRPVPQSSSDQTPPQLLETPTPWNHIEAGMSVGLDKPVLIVKRHTTGGIFDLDANPPNLVTVDLSEPGILSHLAGRVRQWCLLVQESLPDTDEPTPGDLDDALATTGEAIQ